MRTSRGWTTLAAAGLAVAVIAGCAAPRAAAGTSPPGARGTITSTATGTVEGTPDTVVVTLGVESRARSAEEALARNAERATRVIEALQGAGVPRSAIQTTQLSVSPTFTDEGHIDGYSVSNLVTAKSHDAANAGKMIDAAAAQAGDDIRVQGVTLSIEDDSELMDRARTDAVKQARAQAEQLADAAGVSLGAPRSITEQRASSDPRFFAADAAALRATPIEPGTQALTVDVKVVYEIG